ncbi:7TM-DISM domain-containing protein [Lysobacter silvisoli]|uniref:7TM-DISM domain-containing protein n=1 Tax=Lysobacter silvisoli TaxID=2293254 RepID=UPI0013148C70|nr:7TM-DISM domain-containing protein [Lysobacter silvisoli]
MRRIVWSAWMVWLLLFGWAGTAAAQAVTVELLDAPGAQAEAPRSAAVLARWSAPAPDQPTRVEVPQRPTGHWLRLRVDRDIAASEQRMVEVQCARSYGAARYYPPGSAQAQSIPLAKGDEPSLLSTAWKLPLREGWRRADAAYFRVPALVSCAMQIGFTTQSEVARRDESARRFAIGAYSVLLLMTLFVFGLWLAQRDPVYLYYCGYLVSISVYMLVLSGWIVIPEHWGSPPARRNGVAWSAATLATVFQLLFTVRFLDLPRWLPRTARFLRALAWTNLAWLAVLVLAFEQTRGFWYLGGNGLLLLAIPVLLWSAVMVWRRGGEYAGYYLLGWTPLMAFAGMIAAKTFGIGQAYWPEYGLVLTVVLESGVLMLALTQRAAERHRRGQ